MSELVAELGYACGVATPRAVKRAAAAIASVLLLVVACANDVESRGEPSAGGPGEIATNLDVPWGIAFLPDGSALIAERNSGAIKHMTAPGAVNPVGAVAGVAARGEGGLLGLATAGQTVFAYLTTGQDNRVVRMGFDGSALTEQSPILTGIPAASIHDGGRIAFGPDGKLYVATGESGDPQLAQDRSSLGGKILRINPDGSDPAGQSRSGVAGLVIRPPQHPRAGVGFGGPTVGHGVRRESVGRAQPDPVGRQLRVADGRGSRRHARTDRPGDPVGD